MSVHNLRLPNTVMLTHPLKPTKKIPTHSDLTQLIASILPPHPRDVQSIYHEPRYPGYDPASAEVHDVVLSITPTPGLYTKLSELTARPRRVKPFCFLHRPFNLDRKAVPRGTLVQACHKRFDEVLTVGWNVALAARLGLDLATSVCIQGYKGDPDRRIGLVAKLSMHSDLKCVHRSILREFLAGDLFPPAMRENYSAPIEAIAIMNAFGTHEVNRVVDSAVKNGMIAEGNHARLLYLTGEPKDPGLATLTEQYSGMAAICVGHRPAEEWGIKYLAARIEHEFDGVHVHVVLEDEEEIPKVKCPKGVTASTGNMKK